MKLPPQGESGMLELPGSKVVLREFSREHLEDPRYFSWLRDPEVMLPIYRLEYLMPMSMDAVRAYVESLWSSGRDCFFAIHEKDGGQFIGTQRIGHIDWRTGIGDIGILIGERDCWGRGYATDAVATACAYAFGMLSLRRLTAGTPASNEAMCRCFERLGFTEEGRLRRQLLIRGKYEDHVLFGLLAEEYRKE
jgi:RimJ/RimL family protein N-acetyltransferase